MTLEQKELKFDELVVLFGIAAYIFGAKNKKLLSHDFFDF